MSIYNVDPANSAGETRTERQEFHGPRPIGLSALNTLAYGLAVFASAFLLFEVQPLITKIILPWFGGAAAVWTVCLVFFQVVLLFGYFYAHVLTSKVRSAVQGRVHAALLAASILALPILILPKDHWKPSGPNAPVLHILALLAVTVGLPYLALSSTSPLLQAWYRESRSGAPPYRFYALSNVGSMLALLAYPVLIEPRLTSAHQAAGWSGAYAAVAVLCGALGLRARNTDSVPAERLEEDGGEKQAPDLRSESAGERPDANTKVLWAALAACGSALLLAVTNHITQNIASVPFLWVIPLSLYLFSFILCFDRAAWYPRSFFLRLLGVALGSMAYALAPSFPDLPIKVMIPVYCGGFLVCCMFCQGELARLKPHPAYLTEFYWIISLGAALGAVFVALVAPHVFSGYYEMHVALGFCALLVLVVNRRDPGGTFHKARWLVLLGLAAALIASLAVSAREDAAQARLSVRNFYGVLRVIDHAGASGDSAGAVDGDDSRETGHVRPYLTPYQTAYRRLMNGTIDHGLQFLSPELRRRATTYYSENSGIGLALSAAGERGALRVGIVGLGAGTLATYGRPGDRYTFYEINPLDVQIANQEFTFLRESKASIDIVLGDAWLSLEREPVQQYDVLAVDAFSSDSIPVHLLTRQAFELYFRHLRPDGVLAVHVSNLHLNLQPVVEAAAISLNKEAVMIDNPDDHPNGIYRATWILMGSPQNFSGRAKIEEAGAILLPTGAGQLWTDDYSSLYRILK